MKDKLIIRLLYFVRYFGDSLFYSFFQLFLYSRGLSESKIGIIIALTPIMTILVNPFWNFVSKDANVNCRIMKIITVIEGLLIIIMGNLDTFEIMAVVTAMIAIVGSPFYSLFDGYTATFAEFNQMEYSKVRRIGSLAYIFGCSLGGILISFIGYTAVFFISGLLFILCCVLFFLLKPLPLCNAETRKRDYKDVLTNKKFYLYLLFYVTTFSIATLGDNFFGVFLNKERGITDTMYGQIVSAWVIVEFVVMIILSKLPDTFKHYYLYIMIGLIYVIRLLAVGLNLPTPILIGIAVLRGVSMGTILHIHLKHLRGIIGLENITAGILIIAVVSAIVLALGNASCGYLIESFGYQKTFMWLGMIVLVSTICYIIYGLFKRSYISE